MTSIREFKIFAFFLKMSVTDSWSKLPEKIKYGNTFDFGKFDQCLSVRQRINQVEIIGQHCLFQFYSKSNGTVSQGPIDSLFNQGWKHLNERFGGAICLPAACKPVKTILHFLLNGSDFNIAEDYEQADYCKTLQTSRTFSKWKVAAFFITGFFLICVVLSSVYDLSTKNDKTAKPNEWFLVFSLHKNLSSLMQINDESTYELKSLSFMRFYVAIYILFAHVIDFTLWFPSVMHLDCENSSAKFLLDAAEPFLNLFFVISGFLVTRAVIKDMKM